MQGIGDDPELTRMLQIEGEKAKFQSLVHNLTDVCWDKCVPDKPGNKLDSKTENCLINCVERFLDTSTFVVKRLDAAAASRWPWLSDQNIGETFTAKYNLAKMHLHWQATIRNYSFFDASFLFFLPDFQMFFLTWLCISKVDKSFCLTAVF